jgi:hypothetical protein
VEELLFFFLTNAMVVCGMTLLLAPESKARPMGWASQLAGKPTFWARQSLLRR